MRNILEKHQEITSLKHARRLFDSLVCTTPQTARDVAMAIAGAGVALVHNRKVGSPKELSLHQEFTAILPLCAKCLTPLLNCPTFDGSEMLAVAETISPFELGLIYEASLSYATRKAEGAVFTPKWLAEEIVEHACAPREINSIVDPACGGGAFLISAFNHLVQRHGITAADALRRLYGIDRDPYAVEITRAALLLAAMKHEGIETNQAIASHLGRAIINADALIDETDLSDADPKLLDRIPTAALNSAWPEVTSAGGFDAVIGNPPYGLSRAEQISQVELAILKRTYAAHLTGKMNKYLLFMIRGFGLLNPRGVLSFVVPNSWLGINNAAAVRRLLLPRLRQLDIFHFSVFENPSVEVVTFVAQKNFQAESCAVRHRRSIQATPFREDCLRTQSCLDYPGSTIPVAWSSDFETFLERMRHTSFELGSDESPFVPMIALQAYALGKGTPPQSRSDLDRRSFNRATADAEDVHPYLQGSDVERYAVRWSGKFLKYGPWLAEPQKLSRFTGPRIVVREILGASPHLISAAFLEHTALYNKSVLHIIGKTSPSRDQFLSLLAVLNSQLAAVYFAYLGKKTQRRIFPKLLNADLKSFPLPREMLQEPGELARLSETRMRKGSAPELDAAIEYVVRQLYGVDRLPEFPPHTEPSPQPALLSAASNASISA